MADFIKSYSNYVLKRKHQDIDSGSIYERDITTIGGLNQFAKGQVPIYKSSNFIITVNNETKAQRNFLNDGWEKNGSEEVWTLNNINDATDIESAEKTLKIVLKQDYFWLYTLLELIGVATVIYIVNKRGNPSYKIAWIVFILALPVFGILVYLLWGGQRTFPHLKKKMKKWSRSKQYLDYSEMQYKCVKKKIIVEEYLKPKNGLLPEDYKVYCFQHCLCLKATMR